MFSDSGFDWFCDMALLAAVGIGGYLSGKADAKKVLEAQLKDQQINELRREIEELKKLKEVE